VQKGSFALLEEGDPCLSLAHEGVVRVLHTLANLYETRADATQYSIEELIGHVQVRYPGFPSINIRIGLYPNVIGFGAIRTGQNMYTTIANVSTRPAIITMSVLSLAPNPLP
jgi:hypothetical protein